MSDTLPLWLSVSKDIEEKITSGFYSTGELIPGELELCKIYNVSRITIRSALARLEDAQLVRRVKGKGTVVYAFYLLPAVPC